MARKNHTDKRKNKSKQENKKFLIVTEDTKSACNYFKVLKDKYRLHTLKIEIKSSKKSAPDQVISFTKEKSDELEADLSFCIIDRDTHENFDKALNDAKKIKNLEIIASYPCFEYWIILHHDKNCHKPMNAKECFKETTNRFETYDKSMDYQQRLDFYEDELVNNQDKAIEKAKTTKEICKKNNAENPKTDIYKLFNTADFPFYKKQYPF